MKSLRFWALVGFEVETKFSGRCNRLERDGRIYKENQLIGRGNVGVEIGT